MGGPPPPPHGDMWVRQVVIALREIAQATACTAKKRSRLITNRNVRSKAPFAKFCSETRTVYWLHLQAAPDQTQNAQYT